MLRSVLGVEDEPLDQWRPTTNHVAIHNKEVN